MSDKYVEKIFLYLILVSLLLHAGLFILIINLPEEKPQPPESPYMVELRDLPVPPEPPKPRVRDKAAEKPAPPQPKPAPETRPVAPAMPAEAPTMPPPERGVKRPEPGRQPEGAPKGPAAKEEPAERLVIRKKEAGPELAKLFPSGRGMAEIEDSYRKKYGVKVGGDTLFLDRDDDLLGSFSRRFLEAVRGRWNVVGRQLVMNNDTGYGLLLVVISRAGIVEEARVVESSGNPRVDAEIIRTVKTAGYVGPLPKKWPYEKVQGYYIYSAGYDIRN